MPILKKLVNLPFGGKTPFSAEMYFINTTVKLDILWGTTDPIQLIDPKYYVKLRIRAFGQMGIRVRDAVVLFREVTGGLQKADIVKFDKIKEYYKGILIIKAKSAIAEAIITNGISALELSAKLERLSEKIKEQIMPEFERYGFFVSNFYIQSINFPDEDFERINKILEDKAAFEIMGEGRYTKKRTFDVYEGAATNQSGLAGTFVSGGIGLGTALRMENTLNQTLGGFSFEEEMIECAACHAKIKKDAKFCSKCGVVSSNL